MFRLFAPRRRWRVHLCATTPDQKPYAEALTRWLRANGHTLLAAPGAPLGERIAAARECEVCLLILGPEYGACEPHASFSATELETYAALEDGASKLLIFSQRDADSGASVEQREFIARLRDFTGGTFQATIAAPERLPDELAAALARMEAAQAASRDLAHAIMISSTGDLVAERTRLRQSLTGLRHPVIDYQTAASETGTPIERVTAWAEGCRALLLILGRRYGFVSPVDGLGVTELEFVTALSAGRPILALIRPDALTTGDPDQIQFLARVRHFLPAGRIRLCPTLDDLEREARQELPALLKGGATPRALPAIPGEQAHAWYQRQVQRWLGTLPHARNPAGMPLDSMPLLLVEQPIGTEALLDTTDSKIGHLAPEGLAGVAAITPDDALASNSRLIIAGPAGAGKTTILHWYALRHTPATGRTPILVSLPDYARARRAERCDSLLTYIEREERRLLLATPGDASRWRAALEAGRGLLLLDDWSGLDAADRETVAVEISACAAALPPETAVVVAQRELPAAQLAGFTPRYVLPLLQAQLEEIIWRWVAAARQVEELTDRQARALFVSITFQARGLSDFTNWARTPLLLTTLITILDASDLRMLRMLAGSGSALLRRALRIILTQARRPRLLYEKERLLLEVARRTLAEEPRAILPAATLQAAWSAAAPGATTSPDAILRDLSPLLTNQRGAWSYLHSVFSAVYSASALAAQPEASRNDQITRRRLYADWNTVPALLAGELDRLGRPAEGDAVVGALLAGDGATVAGSGHPDPFNIALYTAVASQGARATEFARAGRGPEIARRLGAILREQLRDAEENRFAINQTTWSLLLLGPAAAEVMDDVAAALDAPLGYARLILASLAVGGDTRARALVDAYDATHPSGHGANFASMETLVEWLREDLRDDDEATRRDAAIGAATFGPLAAPAIPELTALLEADDWLARKYAARALTAIGTAPAPALPKLLDLALYDPVGQVEYAARDALTRVQGAATLEQAQAIAPELRSDDYQTAQRAARTLAALGPVAAPLAPDLIWLGIEGKDGLATLDAGAALVALGPEAVGAAITAIAAAVQGDEWRPQRQALDMVKAMKAHAAPLLDLLRACGSDVSYLRRSDAIMATGYLGEAALPALDDLRAWLADPATRNATLIAITQLGPLARPLLDDVLALREDSYAGIRRNVYDALRTLDPPVTPAIEAALLAGFVDEDDATSNQALLTASALRPVTPAIAAELLRRYYAPPSQPGALNLRFDLQRLLLALWDAGGA